MKWNGVDIIDIIGIVFPIHILFVSKELKKENEKKEKFICGNFTMSTKMNLFL